MISRWHHLDPRYNFEIDKWHRVSFDFSTAHQKLAKQKLKKVVVFHYSGKLIKPWDFLIFKNYKQNVLRGARDSGAKGDQETTKNRAAEKAPRRGIGAGMSKEDRQSLLAGLGLSSERESLEEVLQRVEEYFTFDLGIMSAQGFFLL